MGKKSAKIAELVKESEGRGHNAHYRGYFECFNRGMFYEAHDVLEELWLADRTGRNGAFYKGLIQLAGAFVHLQKARLRPAAALFKLAQANLRLYPRLHESLDTEKTLTVIADWLQRLETIDSSSNKLTSENAPRLHLREP